MGFLHVKEADGGFDGGDEARFFCGSASVRVAERNGFQKRKMSHLSSAHTLAHRQN